MLATRTDAETAHRRSRRRTRTLRPLAVSIVGLASAAALLGLTGGAAAYGVTVPYGFSTPDGSFVLPYYQALISTPAVSPSTLVFGDTLYIEFLNALGNRSITVSSVQSGAGLSNLTYNESFSVAGRNITVLNYNLPSSERERSVRLCVDGGCMTFSHVSPVTLIPSGIFTIGGLDALVFGTAAGIGLLLIPATLFARWLTRKALWSPSFHMGLIAPHAVLGMLLLIGYDYQAFDALFSGLGFLIFPLLVVVMYFFWVMPLFNVAIPVEVLNPQPTAGQPLHMRRARIWIGEMPDGSRVLVGARIRDWWARLWGHVPRLSPADQPNSDGGLAEIPLVTTRTETRGEKRDRYAQALRRRATTPVSAARALDGIPLRGSGSNLSPKEKDPPRALYFVDSDDWLRADMPYLAWHREVKLPDKLGPDGNVVERGETVRRISWPHYVTPVAGAHLAGIHYLAIPSVTSLLWRATEVAYRRLGIVRASNFALRAAPFVLADEATQTGTDEIYSMLAGERFPLTDEEADEETRSEAPKPSAEKPDGAPHQVGGPPPERSPAKKGGR